jgi:hypothetical protein
LKGDDFTLKNNIYPFPRKKKLNAEEFIQMKYKKIDEIIKEMDERFKKIIDNIKEQ